jgi:hypothetical protein
VESEMDGDEGNDTHRAAARLNASSTLTHCTLCNTCDVVHMHPVLSFCLLHASRNEA